MVMSEYVPIKVETVKSFADEARRLGGVGDELTTAQMTEIFSGVTSSASMPNAENSTFGTAETVYEYGITCNDRCGINNPKNLTGGYKFKVNDSIALHGFRVKTINSLVCTLWDAEGNELAKASLAAGANNNTWNEYILDYPVNLTLGESYYVTSYYSGYAAFNTGTVSAGTSKITIEGKYAYWGGYGFPNTVESNYYYGIVDVVLGPPTNTDVPTEYKIQRTTLTGISDEVKRITGVTGTLSTSQILTALQGVQAVATG